MFLKCEKEQILLEEASNVTFSQKTLEEAESPGMLVKNEDS